MKNLLTILLLFFAFVSVSQEEINDINVPSNEINFEHGYFNRGLAALTYTRNFGKREFTYWSSSVSFGAGAQFIDAEFFFDTYPIYFITISPSYQYGENNSFLSLGLELKNISSRDAYNGFGVGAYAGYVYNGPKGFLIRFRLGATTWTSSPENSYYSFLDQNAMVPMGGVSIGFSFGNPL